MITQVALMESLPSNMHVFSSLPAKIRPQATISRLILPFCQPVLVTIYLGYIIIIEEYPNLRNHLIAAASHYLTNRNSFHIELLPGYPRYLEPVFGLAETR